MDDIARKDEDANVQHLAAVAEWDKRIAGDALQETGGAQNIDKQMNRVHGAGRDAGDITLKMHEKNVQVDGQVVSGARYLGGRLHFNEGFSAEKKFRMQALRAAWRKMGEF